MLNLTDTDIEASVVAHEEGNTVTGKTKIKDHKGGRLWLEGTKLFNAGFTPKARYGYTVSHELIIITLDISGDKAVSGKEKRSIIDLSNKSIGDAFGLGTAVDVVYTQGIVVITKR